MATRVYSPKAYKSDEDEGTYTPNTAPGYSPKPKPRPKKDEGRSLKTIMSATPSTGRETSRRKLTPATGTSSKPPPKSTRHVHDSSTNRKTTPKKAPLAPEKGRQSGMYKTSSKGRTSAKIPQYEKKKKQLKRSKAWAKRYATGGADDRG